ncbi:MAG: type I-G CRISPR-associated protein Csb2, partial [Longimicrobiales bacterium]
VHMHAFYLPEDADGDGFIDHILIHAPGGLCSRAIAALDGVPRLWTDSGNEWRTVFMGSWLVPAESGSMYCDVGKAWLSVTPYLHPWHSKPGFGVVEQIRRECGQRGMPEPAVVRAVDSIPVHGRERRPVHFHRFRSKRGLHQPDRHGSMIAISFAEPIAGPLALGFGCHYGLGMFAPAGPVPGVMSSLARDERNSE